MTPRTSDRSRESTGQISLARLLLETSSTQRGWVSQTISDCGNEHRSAAMAGKVWTMSPREPRRTIRKRGSGMRAFADGLKERARGVILGIANDGHADAEAGGDGAFGNGFGGVVRTFGVHVGPQLFEELFYIGFREDDDVIHAAEGCHQNGASAFVQNRTARAFQRTHAGIAVDTDDQEISLLL